MSSSLPMPNLPYPRNTSNPYEKIRPNNTIAKMQFPLDMGKYYIAFQFAEYSSTYNSGAADALDIPANFFNSTVGSFANLFGFDVKASTNKATRANYGIGNINAHIALPIPPNLVDDQQLDYNSQNLLNVAGAAASSVADYATRNLSQGAKQAITTAESVVSSVSQFGSVFSGQTVNPFLAMMFNGPRFKTHQFGWRFSPRNSAETDEVVKIVNTFKAKSLPVQHASGTMFAYPDVCMISLYPESARDKMYTFKPAVITQTSVHYAPSGTPSFFAGSTGPAEIELKIQLSEISIWTNNDFPTYNNP